MDVEYELGYKTIGFCIVGICVFIIFACYLYKEQLKFKKGRRALAKFHEQIDDDEEGDETTQYIISFFASSRSHKYHKPPTGRVVIHLVGSLFPGKVHELRASKPEEDFQLFAPLAREMFLVTEDVGLGRIVGIVLRTNVEGPRPFWSCSTVIVRNVLTHEAWYFRVHGQVSYPPALYFAATQKELCAFKLSYIRRLRREIRSGQFGYFGFLFRSNTSVYTFLQRWVTAIGLYSLLFVTCYLFVDYVFTPAYNIKDFSKTSKLHQRRLTRIMEKTAGTGLKHKESSVNYWIYHIVLPAVIGSFITTIIGFFIISFFRQASIYETRFDEMDYVIGTALLEQVKMKEKTKLLNEENFPPPQPQNSDTSHISQKILRGREELPNPVTSRLSLPKLLDIDELSQDVDEVPSRSEQIYGFLRGVTKKTLVAMKLRKESDPPESEGRMMEDGTLVVRSLPNTPRRSLIFEPGGTPPKLEVEKSPFRQRYEMRRLFVEIDLKSGHVRRFSGRHDFRMSSHNFMSFKELELPVKGKGKIPAHALHIKPASRKWYQPILAWLTVIMVILLSAGFIATDIMLAKFHEQNTTKFLKTLWPSVILGWLIGIFILEPGKVLLIALYHATKDKKLYKRIQKTSTIQDQQVVKQST